VTDLLERERSSDGPFVRADFFALTSQTPVLSLGSLRLAALSQPIILGAGHVLDEAGAPEALCGPVFGELLFRP
jgi:hypothetical protein